MQEFFYLGIMRFVKKHWFNILISVFLVALIVPQTSFPIKVFFQELFMMSPGITDKEDRSIVEDYRWQLISPTGTPTNFSEASGKVVVLNFWATWCPPCVAELPSMQQLYKAYQGRVAFYFVTAEDGDTVRRFLVKKGYDVPVYLQTTEAPESLQVQTIPTTFVIDSNGEIVIQKTGAANWDSQQVHELLDTLISQGN